MRNIIIVLMVILFSSCSFRIEQEIRKYEDNDNKKRAYYCTFVWHNGEVIKSWFDRLESMPDSIPCVRKGQAKFFVKKVKGKLKKNCK